MSILSNCLPRVLAIAALFMTVLSLANAAPPAAATAAKAAGRTITLSDFGAEDLAYLAIPATPPTMGIVLVPDAYGLDDFTKGEADRLAAMGYIVVAVDIYNGKQTTDPGDLANLIANMNADSALKTIDSGVRLFRESPKYKVDHIIAMGWGTGATYVFQTIQESKSNLDGAITFYGPCPTPDHEVGKFYAPLCAVYSDRDPGTTRDTVLSFQQRMKAAGNDCEAWFVAAGAGWSNPKSKAYNPGEDREAWKVAVPFIIRIAALPPRQQKGPSVLDKAKDKFESLFQ
jgi:carboxymethylenebutenolidase